MKQETTYWVEAASGLHRRLRVTTAHRDTRQVRAALLDAVAVHDVPCAAQAHEVSLRKQGQGWKVAVRCHDGWAETVHPPTVGTLVEVPVYELPDCGDCGQPVSLTDRVGHDPVKHRWCSEWAWERNQVALDALQ